MTEAVLDVTRPDVSGPSSSGSHIHVLVPDRLYALHNVMDLDGRVAAYPGSARGYAPVNCYILKEPDGALMIDTGFTAHRAAILRQVEDLIGRDTPLTLFPLRMNEFMSLANVMALAAHFPVDSCISVLKDAAYHVDLESLSPADIAAAAGRLKTQLIAGNEWLTVGHSDRRRVKLFQSPVRLIATRWVFDPSTHTLFTSDMFTGSWSHEREAEWVVNDKNDDMTAAAMRSFLLNTRYWWLEGAKTDSLRRSLASVFSQCDIRTIAPGYGKILQGASVVARHFALLDEVLLSLDQSKVRGRYVGRDEER